MLIEKKKKLYGPPTVHNPLRSTLTSTSAFHSETSAKYKYSANGGGRKAFQFMCALHCLPAWRVYYVSESRKRKLNHEKSTIASRTLPKMGLLKFSQQYYACDLSSRSCIMYTSRQTKWRHTSILKRNIATPAIPGNDAISRIEREKNCIFFFLLFCDSVCEGDEIKQSCL